MDEDVLSTVMEVEREIQEKLEAERRKAREWLERVRADAGRSYAASEERFKKSSEKAVADALADVEARAADLLSRATLEAERLVHLGDETMRKIMARYLPRILPGEHEHDRQDVKG